MMREHIRYYSSFDEEFERSHGEYELPRDYEWIRRDGAAIFRSRLVYAIARLISPPLCKMFLHAEIIGADKLREFSCGAFLYANHTQPIGDVVLPGVAVGRERRVFTVVGTDNYAIPFIGRILSYLGALPIPHDIRRLRLLSDAIEERIRDGNIVTVFPEGRVWKYFTGIRPFREGAFSYPAKLGKASFCITSVYKRRKIGRKPRLVLYVDGPFYPDENIAARERPRELCDRIHAVMESRAALSDCEYIKYIKR